MTSDVEEWIDRAIPAGSGRYYALLHSDPSLQEKQRYVATLVSIFSKLGFQSREVEVVKHKLDWWRQELERESFSHPVTSALGSVNPVERQQLIRLLNGYGSLLEAGSPSTDEQNHQFHLDTGAAACHLLCGTHNNEAVTQAGVVLSKFRCLHYLTQHVNSGLLCIPMSSLDTAGISPALLTPSTCTDAVINYLSEELSTLQKQMQKSSEALESQTSGEGGSIHQNCKALYIYLSLQSKLLHSMRKDNTSVVEQISRLTPIRNYWYAFRAARRYDKLH